MSLGQDLMHDISNGSLAVKSSKYAEEVKHKVTEAMIEIIQFGARVRPLMLGSERIGWARAVSYGEKKQIDTWYPSETEQIETTLCYATTLTRDDIRSLDMVELNNVLRAILKLNLADLTLFPYLSAFVSTQTSYNLWSSKQNSLDTRTIPMPDGTSLRQLATPDHILLWAALSAMRMDTINRLENAQNAGTIVRGFVGSGADNYNNAINKAIASLRSDSIDPWLELINFMSVKDLQSFDDGYGHSHQDNSVEGMMREMKGMTEGDKHEELMRIFHETQVRAEEEKKKQIQALVRRRKELDEVDESIYIVRTESEVKKKEALLKQQQYDWVLEKQREELLGQDAEEAPNILSKYL
jgi:hypothetical protein